MALFFPSCIAEKWSCPSKPMVVHSHPLSPQIRPNQVRYRFYVGYRTNNHSQTIKNYLIRVILVFVTQPVSGLSNKLCYVTCLIGFGGI